MAVLASGTITALLAAISSSGIGSVSRSCKVPPGVVRRASRGILVGDEASTRIASIVGTGSFDPTSIAGCQLWLRASLGITLAGGKVSGWADQSGNGNNLAQTTDAARPTFNSSAVNGLPGVTGGPTLSLDNTTANVVAASHARTIFAVAKASSDVGGWIFTFRESAPVYQCGLLRLGGAGDQYLYGDAAGNIGHASSPVPVNGVSLIFEQSWDGVPGSLVITRVSGTLLTFVPDAGTTGSDSGSTGFSLADPLLGRTFAGDVCDLIVYDTVLSAGNATAVRSGLGSYYGISVS